MKPLPLLLVLLTLITSACRVNDEFENCRLVKFVTENTIEKSFYYDYITLKDERIENIFSIEINNNKDTVSKSVSYFEYNESSKVKAVRDETILSRIIRFDADLDNNGNAIKIRQTINGVLEDVITVEYDSKNRPVNITSNNQIGINRSMKYTSMGNPNIIMRPDARALPTITEHTFDTKRNFFFGIPEIQFYWIIRPLNSFIPYGDNNIVSTKVFIYQKNEFQESESQSSKRELVYNNKGYPETVRIIQNDASGTVTNISSFGYDCLK